MQFFIRQLAFVSVLLSLSAPLATARPEGSLSTAPLSTSSAADSSSLYTTSIIPTTTTTTSTPTPPSTSTSSAATATGTIAAGIEKWSYIGCYNETVQQNGTNGARTLQGLMTASDLMTVEMCLDFCGTNTYAGLEYTRECWCSPYLSSVAAKLSNNSCDMGCLGNESERCGGSWKLTIYQQASTAAQIKAASVSILIAALFMGWFGGILDI